MKKFLLILLGFIFISNCSFAKAFSDVGSTYWASSIINEWTNNRIMSGYEDGTFRPESEVTKAELVVILNKINNDNQIVNKRPSKDIKFTDWYCADMGIALKNGLIELDANGNLNPKSKVTCEEAITMISKLLKEKNVNISAVVKDAFSGRNNSKINLKKNITRAELTSILDSMIDKICTNGTICNQNLKGNLIINGNDVSLSNVQVDGKIILLKGTRNGDINFNNVYASKGIISDYKDVISYNDGTKTHNNLSNIEKENNDSKVHLVKIDYSETDWTTKNVTATLKFDDEEMEIINNDGDNKYKFIQNGEFTFICVDNNGKEHRYTAKVDNIARKDLKFELDIQDNTSNAVVTVNILENEAPIEKICFIKGKESSSYTLKNGDEVINNQFTITETGTYTVAIEDEAGNTAKTEFYWKNTSKHVIRVIQNVGGAITPGTTEVQNRENATFEISVDSENGYYLEDVLVDGVSQGLITKYTFTNVTTEHTIEAKFSLYKYTVTVIPPQNGKIEPDTMNVEFGKSQRFIIIPNEGYEIKDVIVDGASVGAVDSYSFENVREEHTITAVFEIKKYNINVVTNQNGTVTPGTTLVDHGDEITFFITPDVGYEIKNVIIDNVTMGPRLAYTFKVVKSAHTLVVIFVEIPYTGALETTQIGDNVYATIYEDYSCVIYGVGDTYNFSYPFTDKHPLGEFADKIKQVKVNLGVENIGESIFAHCVSIENIELPSSIKNIGRNAFLNCNMLKEIVIPSEVEEIKEMTFYNCDSLTNIIIPDSVKAIKADAFGGCDNLEILTLSKNLETIGDKAFKDCKSLIDTITIPEGTISVGKEAYKGCDSLVSVVIPSTVSSIGADAFDSCISLKNITLKGRRNINDLGRTWLPDGGEYRETAVGNNYIITKTAYEIKVIKNEGGEVSPGTVMVDKLQNQIFEITPNQGYKIVDVIIDGVSVGAVESYTFEEVNSSHTLEVIFEIKELKIYGNSVQNGIPSPDNPVEIQSVGDKTNNLLPYPYYDSSKTTSEVEWKIENDRGITVSGTASDYSMFILSHRQLELEDGKKYYFGLDGKAKNLSPIIAYFDKNGDRVFNKSDVIEWKSEYSNLELYLQVNPNRTTFGTVYPYFIEENQKPKYEPYGKYKIPLVQLGKNLLSDKMTSIVNPDGDIENGLIINGLKPNTTYSVSYKLKDENVFPEWVYVLNSAISVSPPEAHLTEGAPCQNVKFTTLDNIEGVTYYIGCGGKYNLSQSDIDMFEYIQVEEGNEETSYEPYGNSKGKNLFDISKVTGPYFTVENKIITNKKEYASDTNETLGELAPRLVVGRTYTLSMESTSDKKYIYLRGDGTVWHNGKALTITQPILDGSIGFYGENAQIMNIQIEEGTVATAYEPYRNETINYIYLDEPLRKIGDYADYIDFENNQVVRNIVEKIVNELNFPQLSNVSGFYRYEVQTNDKLFTEVIFANVVCNKLITADYNEYIDNSISERDNINYIRILTSKYATAEELKAGIGDAKIYYVLSEPIKTIIDLPSLSELGDIDNLVVDTKVKASVTYY